jgi:hypothetical protein
MCGNRDFLVGGELLRDIGGGAIFSLRFLLKALLDRRVDAKRERNRRHGLRSSKIGMYSL